MKLSCDDDRYFRNSVHRPPGPDRSPGPQLQRLTHHNLAFITRSLETKPCATMGRTRTDQTQSRGLRICSTLARNAVTGRFDFQTIVSKSFQMPLAHPQFSLQVSVRARTRTRTGGLRRDFAIPSGSITTSVMNSATNSIEGRKCLQSLQVFRCTT